MIYQARQLVNDELIEHAAIETPELFGMICADMFKQLAVEAEKNDEAVRWDSVTLTFGRVTIDPLFPEPDHRIFDGLLVVKLRALGGEK